MYRREKNYKMKKIQMDIRKIITKIMIIKARIKIILPKQQIIKIKMQKFSKNLLQKKDCLHA